MAVQRYQADLHIHTLLSPCGEVEMIPSLIIEAAIGAGLDIIGIADHNSCENAAAVIEASRGSGVKVLPGMEAQSLEGVHLLCLFDEIEQAEKLQESVYASLPFPDVNNEKYQKIFREQIIVDGNDEFVGYCQRYLSLPTSMDIEELWRITDSAGGIMIPSHIDRRSTGLCEVLGMIPDSPDFAAVEISGNMNPEQARESYCDIANRAVVCNSDAHCLSAIGERQSAFYLEHLSVAVLKMACRGECGRRIENA